MKQSQLFTKTSKNFPEGEEAVNAKLLTKGGFINKASAGVYSLLPLGFRVFNKINRIIRDEMDAIGGEELLMPSLVDRKYWEKTNRWDTEIIYKTGRSRKRNTKDEEHDFSAEGRSDSDESSDSKSGSASGVEYGLGWTHEEVIASIALNFIQSYKDLPKAVYQIQTKFRAETRAQGGLLRGREFSMKDLYSFHTDEEDLNRYYDIVIGAYKKIFERLSLKTIVAEASGGAFTKDYTHEFQVLNQAGEDTVYVCDACGFAQNKEIFDASRHKSCKGKLTAEKAIEVGNVFRLGTRFAEAFGLKYRDQNGKEKPVFMGSYGIGPTRIMGTIVEEGHDDKGIIWPEAVSPFRVHLLGIRADNVAVKTNADMAYKALQKAGVEVLYDDRIEASAGEKFADADLVGIPLRAVVSEKTGEKIELKMRTEEKIKLLTMSQLLSLFISH